MNYSIFQGHLVDEPKFSPGQNGGKASAFGRIGVWQGTDAQGNELPSLFIGFTCFGKEAEEMRDFGHKGSLVVISGRFQETESQDQNGKTYINKKVTGNAHVCYKAATQQQAAPVQQTYQQPAQPVYQQPMQNVAPAYPTAQQVASMPQQQMNPWG